MKDFLAIQELVRNNAKVKDIEKTTYKSYSTIRRELKKDNTSIRELQKLEQDKRTLSLMRKRKTYSTQREFCMALSICMSCDYGNVWRKFYDRYGIRVTKYLTQLESLRCNQMSELELDLLRRQILFELRNKTLPRTLKELCELTNATRAYVLAVLKEIPNVYGGFGKSGMPKGYFLTNDESLIECHDVWVANWRTSMDYC